MMCPFYTREDRLLCVYSDNLNYSDICMQQASNYASLTRNSCTRLCIGHHASMDTLCQIYITVMECLSEKQMPRMTTEKTRGCNLAKQKNQSILLIKYREKCAKHLIHASYQSNKQCPKNEKG